MVEKKEKRRFRTARILAKTVLPILIMATVLLGYSTTFLIEEGLIEKSRMEESIGEEGEQMAKKLLYTYLTQGPREAILMCDSTYVHFAIYSVYSKQRLCGNMNSGLEETAVRFTFCDEDLEEYGEVSGVTAYSILMYLDPTGLLQEAPQDWIRTYKQWLMHNYLLVMLLTGISFLVSLGCIWFLVQTKQISSEKQQGLLYRTPLDLLTALIGCAIYLLAVPGYESITAYLWEEYQYWIENQYLGWYQGTICFVIAGLYLLHLIPRLRLEKWYRQTLVYALFSRLRKLYRFFKEMLENLPLVWKTGLLLFAATLGEFLLLWFCLPETFADGYLKPTWITTTSNSAVYRWTEGFTIHYQSLWIWLAWILYKVVSVPGILYLVLVFKKLHQAARELAGGNLSYQIKVGHMPKLFVGFSRDLNAISDSISLAVDERLKSERLKTELITNVSHDIKTPLTSIINFADLIAKEETENPNIGEYASHLYKQSVRLKKLLEDLMEASKASTGNLEVHSQACDVRVLLNQCVGEYEERLNAKDMDLIIREIQEELTVWADPKMLWRVFDNLMNNILKYAQENTRVYLTTERLEDEVLFTFKNISKYPLDVTAQDLTERFVRGDLSRHTEGNGLGLSIAKSLMELQGGSLELVIDGDLFKAILHLKMRIEKTV